MNPTPLRVSTMTVIGNLGAIPDLQRLYDNGHFVPYWWIGEGILKIEYGNDRKGFCMEDILHVSTKEKKRFFNQSSLVFRLLLPNDGEKYKETPSNDGESLPLSISGEKYKETPSNDGESLPLSISGEKYKETPSNDGESLPTSVNRRYKETNIKLFKNGGFQMTGVSSAEMARAALTQLIALNRGRGIWADETNLGIQRFEVCMMNSDYSVGKAIRRDRLYRILVEKYGLWSSFEPTRYQGVNTKFFWNSSKPADAPPGICICPTPCDGDGHGHGVGHCKKITISPFRTGSIIITGAKEPRQLADAYEFMNDVLREHADQVLRDEPVLDASAPVKKKVAVPPTTTEGIIRQKMRASPRNVVRVEG
jgi:TATA-box binding protein (TBP) (component of TFIID and TFIIIB)